MQNNWTPKAPTRRAWPRLALVISAFLFAPAIAAETNVSSVLERLRTGSAFERERAATELRQLGDDALPALAAALVIPHRETRFRVAQAFSELAQTVLRRYENEVRAFRLDSQELDRLRGRAETAKKVEALRKEVTAIEEKFAGASDMLQKLIRLAELDERARVEPEAFGDDERARLQELREERREWAREKPEAINALHPLVERVRKLGSDRQPLSPVEELHLPELAERVEDRRPRVDELRRSVLAGGFAVLNEALARRRTGKVESREIYAKLVEEALAASAEKPTAIGESFEELRYHRALLWELGSRADGPDAKLAAELLDRHIAATVANLADPLPLVRERAADELFLLEARGLAAVTEAIARGGDVSASEFAFLGDLLRWRIRPSTYASTGIDFGRFPELSFRRKRRKIFDYARVAGVHAIPTLRAIVMDDELERSLSVKLAAAKALAGLRDLSGYHHLVRNHAELTLKKPEVSREIFIIQADEYIRGKRYRLAVEELRKVLDEFPFDFRANYQIAFAYLLLKEYEKSIHHFEIARRIEPNDQLTLYNLACAYSLHGKIEEALEALERSVDAGFTDADHIRKDPDLDPLRSHERYRSLLKKLRAATAEPN